MKKFFISIFLLLSFAHFISAQKSQSTQFLVVLGTAQDAGFPHIAAEDEFREVEKNPKARQKVVSLGLIDKNAKQKFLIEATPDLPAQLFALNKFLPSRQTLPDGVFLTHAHIGHYTGLMYFGREAVGARGVPVYAMPRMESFLNENAPWSQLISLKNIEIRKLKNEEIIALNENLKVKPFLVPHRDEFSETVGFEIAGRNKTAVFIPDIDKWSKWNRDLKELIKQADYALVDATFYKNGEIPNRDMSEIPHPFVEETIKLLEDLPAGEKAKVIFIHFNHTNPLVRKNSRERRDVLQKGFRIADEGMILDL
ncbi:MAG TPA: MBL fold metallo-hydrolase [Pyrinomonadaceae bacterium]|nr:MBL fold metallo-hydrolase [Pyrinomonadaceae bacterium]